MHDAMLRGMCHTTAWCLSFRLVVRLSVLSRCRIETDERITVSHTGFRSKQFGKLENETPQKRRKIAPFLFANSKIVSNVRNNCNGTGARFTKYLTIYPKIILSLSYDRLTIMTCNVLTFLLGIS